MVDALSGFGVQPIHGCDLRLRGRCRRVDVMTDRHSGPAGTPASVHEVTLLVRAGCGSCGPAHTVLEAVCADFGLRVTCIDVDEAAATDLNCGQSSETASRWCSSTVRSTATGRSTSRDCVQISPGDPVAPGRGAGGKHIRRPSSNFVHGFTSGYRGEDEIPDHREAGRVHRPDEEPRT